MDFLTDVPSHYVDADAPIQGIAIESDNFCHGIVSTLEVCASSLAKALLVRDPAVYSPWYVMPPFNALWHHIPLARRAFLGALPVYNVAVHHMDMMPEQMLMDPVNQRIRPESMWAQDVVQHGVALMTKRQRSCVIGALPEGNSQSSCLCALTSKGNGCGWMGAGWTT